MTRLFSCKIVDLVEIFDLKNTINLWLVFALSSRENNCDSFRRIIIRRVFLRNAPTCYVRGATVKVENLFFSSTSCGDWLTRMPLFGDCSSFHHLVRVFSLRSQRLNILPDMNSRVGRPPLRLFSLSISYLVRTTCEILIMFVALSSPGIKAHIYNYVYHIFYC